MKIKNKILIIICLFLALIQTDESDCEKYRKLKAYDVTSINKSDLPSEFSEKAFRLVDEFIKKTSNLDYEIVIFFDYMTGEIIKCRIGIKDQVKLKFNDEEFKGKNIASIHNHPKNLFTPPSGKNFGIFLREQEKFELIAGHNGLWILEGKYVDEELTKEFQEESMKLFASSLNYCLKKFSTQKEIDARCDYLYRARLSKYINDKNINGIQITKKEYNHEPKK